MRIGFVLAVLVGASLVMPAATAAWGSFHGDERNSGFVPASDYQVYKEVWWTLKLKPDTQVEASPVVDSAASIVIIVSWDKKIRAFDQESGAEQWNATMSAKISGTPVVSNGRLFVVDTAGTLNAYNVQKGTLLNTVNVGPTQASLTVHEEKIFIGNEAGDMKSYDADTLTLLWSFNNALAIRDVITVGTGAAMTQACAPQPKLSIPAGQIRGAPAVAYGKVYFGSLNHFVYAVDEFGTPDKKAIPMWVFQTESNVFASPLVWNGHVYIGSYDESFYALEAEPDLEGPVYANTASGQVLCGTHIQPTPEWRYCVPPASTGGGDSKVQSTAAIDGGEGFSAAHVIFGSNNGDVTALHPATGADASPNGGTDCKDPNHTGRNPLWIFHTPTHGAVKSSPAIANNIVVVGSDDGHVYWLELASGNLTRDFKPTGTAPVKSNPALDGQRVFVNSFEGDIYMFGPKIPPRPDLQVTALDYNGAAVTFTIHNRGNAPAGAFIVRVQVDDALLADVPIAGLPAGNSTSLSAATVLAPGNHKLKAIADNDKQVKESDESNNIRSGAPTVAPPPPPAPTNPVPTGKKSPDAGVALVAVLVLAAFALRRRSA